MSHMYRRAYSAAKNHPSSASWLLFFALSVLILGPLLLFGYILSFDLVFTPRMPLPATITESGSLWQAFLHYASLLIPSWLLEKGILLFIFTLAGVGMSRLVASGNVDAVGGYFGGVLYVTNPFTYSRFMAGQYLVLFGYAMLPWLVVTVKKFLVEPRLSRALKATLWMLAISLVSIHSILFSVMIVGAMIVTYWSARNRAWLKCGLAAVATFLVLSSYWITPLMSGKSSEAQSIGGFTSQNSEVYQTDGGVLGLPLNVVALGGFWGDRQERYVLPWEKYRFWPVLAGAFIGLVLLSTYVCVRRRDRLGLALLGAGVAAAVLALGTAWEPLAGVNGWLFEHVPFFKGYREPGKFVAVVALAWVYAASIAVGSGLRGVKKYPLYAPVAAMILLFPLIFAPSMIWGANNQLKSADYPHDWYVVNELMQKDSSHGKALFLPWHQYLSLKTARRVVANPSEQFFTRETVAGDNPEATKYDLVSTNSEFVLHRFKPAGEKGENIAGQLRDNKFRYVIIAKTADYKSYSWLDWQAELTRVYDGSELRVYRLSNG